MKAKIQDILSALQGAGVTVNTEEVEGLEDTVLELSELVDDEDDEEETTERNSRAPVPPAQPQLTANDLALVRKLGKVNWDAITQLATQAPVLLEVTQNAQAERDARKSQLIAEIKANAENTFSDDELSGMSLPVLTKMHARFNVDYSGFGGSLPEFSANMADDDEVLTVQPIILNTVTEEA